MIVSIGNKLCLENGFQKIYSKKMPNWHLLRCITLWSIWIERNDKVFNQEQWHISKVKHKIWDELIIYAQVAWKRVLEQINKCRISAATLVQGFDKSWGDRQVLCRRHDMHIMWNWKGQRS